MTVDEFRKIDLRIGKVAAAERVVGSEKLVKLVVDLGDEERQILGGLGKFYEPESLIGKELAIVCNLEPKIMMGFESRGMLLAADTEDGPVILTAEREVAPGSKIK